MRTLLTEELELVAGGLTTPAFENTQSTKNNGLGNGDQGAPGGSAPHNQAENTAGVGSGTLHTSGFAMDPFNINPNIN